MTEEHKNKIADMIMNDYDMRPSSARNITEDVVKLLDLLIMKAHNAVDQTIKDFEEINK